MNRPLVQTRCGVRQRGGQDSIAERDALDDNGDVAGRSIDRDDTIEGFLDDQQPVAVDRDTTWGDEAFLVEGPKVPTIAQCEQLSIGERSRKQGAVSAESQVVEHTFDVGQYLCVAGVDVDADHLALGEVDGMEHAVGTECNRTPHPEACGNDLGGRAVGVDIDARDGLAEEERAAQLAGPMWLRRRRFRHRPCRRPR